MAVSFSKRASESLDYDFVFADLIPSGDSLQSSTGTSSVTVPSGITAGTKTHNTTTAVVKQYISGGTAGESYDVTCTVTTTVGRILTREITIIILPHDTITPQEVASHIETDLNQEALQRYIDDAVGEITSRFGESTSHTDYLSGGDVYVFPNRAISSITSIVETVGETDTTLSASDYQVKANGRMIKRLATGSNGRYRWAPEVTITYVPVDDNARRKRVAIDLVRLAIQYTALESVRDGDHPETSLSYQRERERILETLRTRQRILA